jgi:hypothetical protein
LEEALLQIDLKEGQDYDVTRIGQSVPYYERRHPYRITKLFGDFVSRDYTVRERPAHFEGQGRRTFLQNPVEKDLLLVGIDLAWDQGILRLIPLRASGTVWFVSEEDDIVDKSPFLADTLHALHAIPILEHEGSYDHFIRKVHRCLLGNVPFAHLQTIQRIQPQIARIIDILEQHTNLISSLPGINNRLQSLQNQDNTFSMQFEKYKRI